MTEPKPIASLSSTLLARKGQAKPAMRPQGFASFGFGVPSPHDDLGWNDMGHDPHEATAPQPISADVVPIQPAEPPAVVLQQAELARELAPEPAPQPIIPQFPPQTAAPLVRAPRAAPGSKGRAAFTLRLDPDRHLQLRLACAVTHRSAQSLMIDALDNFIATQPAVVELARSAGTETSGRGSAR